MFYAFVGSKLNYASDVLGFTKSEDIERVHLTFCKSISNVRKSTSYVGVYGDSWRYPLYFPDLRESYIREAYRIVLKFCNLFPCNTCMSLIRPRCCTSAKQLCPMWQCKKTRSKKSNRVAVNAIL